MRKLFATLTRFAASFAVVLSLALVAPPASADPLDDAKAAGLVGERLDGYLGIVRPSAGADVQRLVQDINLRRRDSYRAIAEQTAGSTLSDVEILAGAKLIARTPAGQYVQNAAGEWVRK
ncbi:MAG: YdbL family protein [Parvibaculaceae bacterium]